LSITKADALGSIDEGGGASRTPFERPRAATRAKKLRRVPLRARRALSAGLAAILVLSAALTVQGSATSRGTSPVSTVGVPALASADPTWTTLQLPSSDQLSYSEAGTSPAVSCTSPTFCMADGFGEALINEWNGSAWDQVPSAGLGAETANLGTVSCATTTFCVAVGDQFPPAAAYQPLIEQWDGAVWSLALISSVPGADLTAVSCPSTSFCMAAGSYQTGSNAEPFYETWDGTQWTLSYGGYTDSWGGSSTAVASISCVSSSFCAAVGSDYGDGCGGCGVYASFLEIWNGSSWASEGPQNLGDSYNNELLDGVSCTGASFCMAAGWYVLSGELDPLTEEWNGAGWLQVAAPVTSSSDGDFLQDVSCATSTFCMATGYYEGTETNYDYATLAEEWDGTAWTLLLPQNPAGSNPGESNALQGVSCSDSNDCMTVGWSETTQITPFAEEWGEAPVAQPPADVQADASDGYAEVFWQPPVGVPAPTQYQVTAYSTSGSQLGSSVTVCGTCTPGAVLSSPTSVSAYFTVTADYPGGAAALASSNTVALQNYPHDLVYEGGPVITNAKVHVIYWLPDFNSANHAEYVNYISALDTFLGSVSGTAYLDLLTQYPQVAQSGSPTLAPLSANTVTFEGGVVDENPLNIPDFFGCGSTCLTDTQIIDEINNDDASWSGNSIVLMATAAGVADCGPGGPFEIGAPCSTQGECSWHSANVSVTVPNDQSYIVIPFPGGSNCSAKSRTSGDDPFIDSAIADSAHELAETLTDPVPTSPGWCLPGGMVLGSYCWTDPSEVADACGPLPNNIAQIPLAGGATLDDGDNAGVEPSVPYLWQNLFTTSFGGQHDGQASDQCSDQWLDP
jgi:hypothetical protein